MSQRIDGYYRRQYGAKTPGWSNDQSRSLTSKPFGNHQPEKSDTIKQQTIASAARTIKERNPELTEIQAKARAIAWYKKKFGNANI